MVVKNGPITRTVGSGRLDPGASSLVRALPLESNQTRASTEAASPSDVGRGLCPAGVVLY